MTTTGEITKNEIKRSQQPTPDSDQLTKNEIKRSQQPTPDSDQFHTTDKSQFYRTIDDAVQTQWDNIRETLSPRLTTYILASNQRYEGHEDQMSSFDVLDKVAGMVSNGSLRPTFFHYLSPAFSVRKMRLNSVIEMNSGKRLTNHRKSGLIRMPTWFVVIRTESIFWGMEKKVSFLIRARRSSKSLRMVSGWTAVWVLVLRTVFLKI